MQNCSARKSLVYIAAQHTLATGLLMALPMALPIQSASAQVHLTQSRLCVQAFPSRGTPVDRIVPVPGGNFDVYYSTWDSHLGRFYNGSGMSRITPNTTATMTGGYTINYRWSNC